MSMILADHIDVMVSAWVESLQSDGDVYYIHMMFLWVNKDFPTSTSIKTFLPWMLTVQAQFILAILCIGLVFHWISECLHITLIAGWLYMKRLSLIGFLFDSARLLGFVVRCRVSSCMLFIACLEVLDVGEGHFVPRLMKVVEGGHFLTVLPSVCLFGSNTSSSSLHHTYCCTLQWAHVCRFLFVCLSRLDQKDSIIILILLLYVTAFSIGLGL